jgi:hypothetical protein
MTRAGTFAFRVNNNERRAIAYLAAHLQRSQSDAVRFVVVEAAKRFTRPTEDPKGTEPMLKGESNAITA